jgi:hypothetical protein
MCIHKTKYKVLFGSVDNSQTMETVGNYPTHEQECWKRTMGKVQKNVLIQDNRQKHSEKN